MFHAVGYSPHRYVTRHFDATQQDESNLARLAGRYLRLVTKLVGQSRPFDIRPDIETPRRVTKARTFDNSSDLVRIWKPGLIGRILRSLFGR
jgi:hypothetical protein